MKEQHIYTAVRNGEIREVISYGDRYNLSSHRHWLIWLRQRGYTNVKYIRTEAQPKQKISWKYILTIILA